MDEELESINKQLLEVNVELAMLKASDDDILLLLKKGIKELKQRMYLNDDQA